MPVPAPDRHRSPFVAFLAAALLLAAAAAHAGGPAPPSSAEAGPFAVGHGVFQAVDPARDGRSFEVQVWYPADPENAEGEPTVYGLLDIVITTLGVESGIAVEEPPPTRHLFRPLVVFSHGSGGLNVQSFRLMETLASYGFVVAAPNHPGNTVFDFIDGTDVPLLQSALDRPQDVSLVIDRMLERAFDPGDPLFLRIDPFAIGVAGHSFGGFTALAMASGFLDVPPDPRVRAIVPIAPAGDIFSDEELASIRIPTLLLGGTEDQVTPLDPNITRPFELLHSRFLYRADIEGASHYHFANICDIAQALIDLGITRDLWPVVGADALIGPYEAACVPEVYPIQEAIRLQNLYVVSFFLRHLGWDFRYARFLTEAYARRFEPDVTFYREAPPFGCGLGPGLALLLPLLLHLRRGRRRRPSPRERS